MSKMDLDEATLKDLSSVQTTLFAIATTLENTLRPYSDALLKDDDDKRREFGEHCTTLLGFCSTKWIDESGPTTTVDNLDTASLNIVITADNVREGLGNNTQTATAHDATTLSLLTMVFADVCDEDGNDGLWTLAETKALLSSCQRLTTQLIETKRMGNDYLSEAIATTEKAREDIEQQRLEGQTTQGYTLILEDLATKLENLGKGEGSSHQSVS